MRILLLEDDDKIARDITVTLQAAGYAVERESDGEQGWFKGDTEDYDAIILDLGLPSLDGLTILKRWRAAGRDIPVLILTARGSWSERVDGIDCGADDYLPKPFRMEELQARLRAIIRRAAGQRSPLLTAGPLTLDTRQMRVSVRGVPVALTPQEYRLINYLMHHAGRVVPHTELIEHLYDHDSDKDVNAIEVLIGRVRRKIGADFIETRRGFGYIIEAARP
jgi:DNA-binding response OmpR family regulator